MLVFASSRDGYGKIISPDLHHMYKSVRQMSMGMLESLISYDMFDVNIPMSY